MNVQELQEKTIEELVTLVQEQKVQARRLYSDVTVKQEKQHKQYRQARKIIARALTIIAQKRAAQSNTAQ